MLRYQKGYIINGYTFVVNKEDVHNARDDMFVEATALLPEPDGWISVKDRLPVVPEAPLSQDAIDNGESFLVCFCDGYIDICTFWARRQRFNEEGVTHWMPLPQPPKEDNDDTD